MGDTEEKLVINVDLDKICEPASKAIRRAYVFSGFAINAATRSDFNTYHLPGKMQFRFVPDSPTPEMTEEYKAEFMAWAIGNALREVIEGFGVFLDRICSACVELSRTSGQTDLASFYQCFEQKGVSRKLRDLATQFGIVLNLADGFDSLTAARNCLSHRRGVIEARDCNENGKLVIRFWEPAVIIQQPDGSEISADKAIREATVLEEGGVAAMRIQETAKEFPVGAVIRLAPEDVKNILWTMWVATFNLRTAFVNYLKAFNGLSEKAAK
jgi:hypothetical protein